MKKSKRDLLKGLAIVPPLVWGKPIISSVVLPAHAQTSMDETDEMGGEGGMDETCASQIIPQITVSCNDTPNPQFRITPYLIQATGDCFTLIQGQEFLADDPLVGDPYTINVVVFMNGNRIRTGVIPLDENGERLDFGCCLQFSCGDIFDLDVINNSDALDTAGRPRTVAWRDQAIAATETLITGPITVT